MARLDDDTHAYEPVDPGAPPPAGPPPNAWVQDVWPWLALFGVLVAGGLLVWLFVLRDRHHARQVVPAVVGLQQQAAISRLQADGYSVKAIVGPARRPRGVVATQSPGGGSQLPKGTTVTLHISSGVTTPAATTTTTTTNTSTTTTTAAAPTAQVPDVSNADLATAEGQIEAAGFVTEADPVDGSGPAGSVQQQLPAAGGSAPAGSVVTIDVVRGGGSVRVPDVVGRSAADARAALAQAKLTFKTVYKPGKAGFVLAESPAGSQPAYTQVVLTVGR
ncbi:MAG: PASTA domain-containing protein [Actinomycetota bacterium]